MNKVTLLNDLFCLELHRDQMRQETDWVEYIRACVACAKVAQQLTLLESEQKPVIVTP